MLRLSQNLLNLRQQRHLTQSYLAKSLGISARTYLRYESGERLPDLHTLVKLADFYHISVDSLLGRDGFF